jgi:hypothetical protein
MDGERGLQGDAVAATLRTRMKSMERFRTGETPGHAWARVMLVALLAIVAPRVEAADGDQADKTEGAAWKPLFDGKTLRGWEVTGFAGHGNVEVESEQLILGTGVALTGVHWTNAFPRQNYEIALEAQRVEGSDFFCGLTFPVGETNVTLIVGGWGGGLVGISSINGMDASENETTKYKQFKAGQGYAMRLRVTEERIEAWIDGQRLVDVPIRERQLSMRAGEIEMSGPLGVAAWQTTSALRSIRYRELKE